MWKKHVSEAIGIRILGDRTPSFTALLNLRGLPLFGGKLVVVLEVPRPTLERGYRLGFATVDGRRRLQTRLLRERYPRLRIGVVDIYVYAVDLDGREVMIREHAIATKDDPVWKGALI